MSCEKAWVLDTKYSGRSTADKIAALRKEMEEKGATVHLLSSLYDISWLLNIRGNDISYVPVVLSYLSMTKDTCTWFLQEEIIDENLRKYLNENGIKTQPYNAFYDYVKTLDQETILMDRSVVNYRICNNIVESNKVIDDADPTVAMKSVKNKTEVDNTRNAHVKEGLLDLSFDTICGFADHGAIVHYAATPESDIELKPEGLLLVDSGGHYLEGTTDITRTFALGPVTDEMKADFTRVCRSNMNLANVRFLHGCTGRNIDIVAREPLWEHGTDYNHGTGHGVGYVLNVHEGPNSFRWQNSATAKECVFEEGMITTDEPGIYIEGKYGIRLENELVCHEGEKNEFGQFMYFENITYVPIDLDAIDPDQMTETEKRRLNEYHEGVYRTVSPFLEGEELAWLKQATRAI